MYSTAGEKALKALVALVVGGLLVALIWGLAVSESNRPRSSYGVSQVSKGVVQLPPGETAVFAQQSGKVSYTWSIYFDGRNTVYMTREHSWLSSYEDEHKQATATNGQATIKFGRWQETLDVRVDGGMAYILFKDSWGSSWKPRLYKQ